MNTVYQFTLQLLFDKVTLHTNLGMGDFLLVFRGTSVNIRHYHSEAEILKLELEFYKACIWHNYAAFSAKLRANLHCKNTKYK